MERVMAPRDSRLMSIVLGLKYDEKKALDVLESYISDAKKEGAKLERDKIQAENKSNTAVVVSNHKDNTETLINGMTNVIKEVHRDNLNNINNVYTPIMENSFAMTQNAMQRNSEMAEIYNNSLREQNNALNIQVHLLTTQIARQNETVVKLIKAISKLQNESK